MNDPVIIGIIITLTLGGFGYTWRVATSYTGGMEKCRKDFQLEIQRVEQNFYEYKLHVANSFASLKHLQESERRTSDALNAINAKLDRLVEGRFGK